MKAYFASPEGIEVKRKKSEEKIKFYESEEGKKVAKSHSKRMKGNQNNLGNHHTDESIKIMSDKKKGDKNPFYGRHHEDETIDQISDGVSKFYETHVKEAWNKGLTKETDERVVNNGKSTSIARIELFQTEEGQELIEEISKRQIEYYETHDGTFKGHHHTNKTKKQISDSLIEFFKSPEGLFICEEISRRNKAFYKTKKGLAILDKRFNSFFHRISLLELKVLKILKVLKVNYVMQFKIYSKKLKKNKYYDFYLLDFKTLIEVDGSYWHTSKKALQNDKLKTKLAKKNGFKLLRITEQQIKDNSFRKLLINNFYKK